ncbi:MAG: 5'-methylthioadenosine/adenosylhomocysteine nucleosidase [Clostridia bacterium]|nr:5'-methylthioadenosine/adenosylhomocysteine nucleosidase [Clostridia bacterium]MBO4429430.1 5'-methylthioadenosine/adenosylhomocysteine nucleosidase [Clostridia bacterium]
MSKKLFGIIGAMDIEVDGLKAVMNDLKTETHGGIKFALGKIGETDVVVAKCGIGKVFAAMCAQTMILCYAPDFIINTGVAGSLSSGVGVLDMVIAKDVVEYDMDTSPLGDPVGLISGFDEVHIKSDESLSKKIKDVAVGLGINAVSGTIASGDTFVADDDEKVRLAEDFGAVACEMEGAAIGQVCKADGVPFAVVRSISDGGNDDAAMSYAEFAVKAADRSVGVLKTFFEGK